MTRLEARLAALAAEGLTIGYGALAHEMGLRMAELTAELERLMQIDAAAGRPLRAALCEGRLLNGLPAQGFFLKAQELGCHDGTDPAGFAAAERARLAKG